VYTVAGQYPRDAWDWALSIQDPTSRTTTAKFVANVIAARDPEAARQLIEAGPLPPETKSAIQSAINGSRKQSSAP